MYSASPDILFLRAYLYLSFVYWTAEIFYFNPAISSKYFCFSASNRVVSWLASSFYFLEFYIFSSIILFLSAFFFLF